MVMINEIVTVAIGQTYYAGNTTNPSTCTVTYLVGFADLSESDQRFWHANRLETFVWVTETSRHDAPTTPARIYELPESVFRATSFATLDDLYARDAAARRSRGGLCRASLPGER